MSFAPNKIITPDSKTMLRDYQHAARLFSDDQFRLAPKHNFLFHVAFGINSAALRNTELLQRYGQEVNMLVKSVDLPQYTVSVDVLNQYNRKKVVQYKHTPNELSIKFHDDNMGLINQLWQNYYAYYYADSISAKTNGAYNRNATRSSDFILSQYGLDNGSTAPFFNYIKIYQMARHEYVMYQLWNPVITNWNHNKLAYSDTNLHDFDMKLAYEAVSYESGAISPNTVEGFGQTHYDNKPSPLVGVNTSATDVVPGFANSSTLDTLGPSILNAAINQVTTAQQTQTNTTVGKSGLLTVAPAQTVSGVANATFPIAATPATGVTVASSSSLGT